MCRLAVASLISIAILIRESKAVRLPGPADTARNPGADRNEGIRMAKDADEVFAFLADHLAARDVLCRGWI